MISGGGQGVTTEQAESIQSLQYGILSKAPLKHR